MRKGIFVVGNYITLNKETKTYNYEKATIDIRIFAGCYANNGRITA